MSYRLTEGTIYFVRRADGEGPVKIGFSTQAQTRFEVLDRGSPYPLVMLAELSGTPGIERRIHHRFRAAHVRCEWFEATAELFALIDRITPGSFDARTLPQSRSLVGGRGVARRPWSEAQKRRLRETRRKKKQPPAAAETVAATG